MSALGVHFLFLASIEELCAAGPGWKRPLSRLVSTRGVNPFTNQPIEIASTNPGGAFEPGTPSRLDLSAFPRVRVEDLSAEDLEHLLRVVLNASDDEVAGVYEIPLHGPPGDGEDEEMVYRVPPALVEHLARLNAADLETSAKRWSEAVARDTDEHLALLVGLARRATAENRQVFTCMGFGPSEQVSYRRYPVYSEEGVRDLVEQLTPTCQRALDRALAHATKEENARGVQIEHLLVALVDDRDSDFAMTLRHHGFDQASVRAVLVEDFKRGLGGKPATIDTMLQTLMGDAWEHLRTEHARLPRIRSSDLLRELLREPARYGFDWLPKRFRTLPSKTRLRVVPLGDLAREAREA